MTKNDPSLSPVLKNRTQKIFFALHIFSFSKNNYVKVKCSDL